MDHDDLASFDPQETYLKKDGTSISQMRDTQLKKSWNLVREFNVPAQMEI